MRDLSEGKLTILFFASLMVLPSNCSDPAASKLEMVNSFSKKVLCSTTRWQTFIILMASSLLQNTLLRMTTESMAAFKPYDE